jgi:hypothetical protein
MHLRFVQKSVLWSAVFSIMLLGFGRAAVAQVDSPLTVSHLTHRVETESTRSTSAILSTSEEARPAPSLNPYGSLERFVAPADWRASIGFTVQARPEPHVQLSRGGSLFWGTVGLFVHSYCNSRTDEHSPVTDPPAGYPTVDAARCDQCDRIGTRALGAVLGGLLSAGSSR